MCAPSSISPARLQAFRILRQVDTGKGNSDTLLHTPQINSLSQLDRNLCTAIVLGVLRWQLCLDAGYRRFLKRPEQQLPDDVALALRVAAFQLLFLDRVPAHAAIFESVEWVKRSAASKHAGLVNAVLRKVASQGVGDRMPAQSAYPEWMVKRWRSQYGADTTQRICEQGQQEQRTALRLVAPDAVTELEAAGIRLTPGAFLRNARYGSAPNGSNSIQPEFALVQDEGSQLVAELLGTGTRILDCCAAPGGKTAVLRQNNPSAQIVACDSSDARLQAMEKRLGRILDMDRTEFHYGDAAELSGIGKFDRILCDVPCSGTGTLARNPEIRHRLRPEDIARQSRRQAAILTSALHLLAPGGRLVYSTCSLEPEENENVVERSLQSEIGGSGRFRRLDLQAEYENLQRQGIVHGDAVEQLRDTAFRDGYLRTIPGVHPCDGFFATLIEYV